MIPKLGGEKIARDQNGSLVFFAFRIKTPIGPYNFFSHLQNYNTQIKLVSDIFILKTNWYLTNYSRTTDLSLV